MSMQPQYAAAPVIGSAQINTPNTARDGTGSIVQLVVGRVPGTRVERIKVRATGPTTAGMIRIFHKTSGLTFNGDGSVAAFAAPNWRLIHEIPVEVATPSDSVEAFSAEWAPANGIQLGPFEQLGVATAQNEQFNVIAQGGHL